AAVLSLLLLTSNSTELHIPASQHISQHIAAARVGRRTNHLYSDADFGRGGHGAQWDIQTGIAGRCSLWVAGGITDPGHGRQGALPPRALGGVRGCRY